MGPIDTDIGNCSFATGFAFLRNTGGSLVDPYSIGNPQDFNIEPHDLAFLDLNSDGCLGIFMGLCTGYRVFIQINCQASVGCSISDLAEPFGQLGFFDVSAFLNTYLTGCP